MYPMIINKQYDKMHYYHNESICLDILTRENAKQTLN